MKHYFKQSLLLWLALLLMPLGVWADREVNQLQFGKQVIEVATDEVITFYDPWGTADIDDQNSYNAQSLTVFKPVEAGKSVQITFEKLDLNQYSTSYYLYINLYDGIADSDDAFSWATSTSSITSSTSLSGMSGTLIAEKINNDNKPSLPATYTSGTADGALSVGFMHRNSNECEGWVAKVKCVQLENMTVTGAGSNYEGVVAVPSVKQNVTLANAFVTATGVMNPDHVKAIHFTMTKNEGAVDPAALKLFKGDTQVTASVEADGDNYKFTLDEALADGTTTFTIKGDILGTAAIGAKVQVDITKIATTAQADGITPFAAGTAVEVENPALVLMTSTPQVVTVGDTPYAFYDEGGKEGGIVSKTNGKVTFLSGVEGKKVMVNFTTNSIWHGSLYNQELRIYAGQEVNADKLIKTLQKGETALVRSTADDGSLTVVLFSDASNDVAADGFEATVSLFTPQPMDVNTLAVSAAGEGTVAAGDMKQEMLTVNVKTENTEPAAQLTKMTFSAGASASHIAKAYLLQNAAVVGECTAFEGATFEIALTSPVALVEGDNLFTLAYDISDEVLNDDEIAASVVSVTALVNNVEKTVNAPANTPEVTRNVKNIVLSQKDQGTVTKTVNGSMAFETKPASEYSTKYEYGTDDRINIFVPKHEGMVCQIDFSSFAVYYASSSYGTRAKFAIYAGQGTTGEKLWELDDNAKQNVGPKTIVRSTAADGALTVAFSPNSSYYSLDGWKATVSEYQSKDMAVTAVEAAQATTADASIGANEQELLNVNVFTEGNLNQLSMSSMKLSLKGTEANIVKVSVWKGGTKLGEAVAAAEVEVAFSEPVTLAEGNNAFVVKADISSDATENQTIDAAVVSVHVGTADVTATAGDPEGARTLKNQLLMTNGNHGTMSLGLGKQMAIYDDGGAEGDGADGVEAVVTIQPTGEAESLKLTNLGISFAYTAYLYIYEGTEVDDSKELLKLTGSSAKFDPFVVDGPVTIKYIGAGSYTKPNFGITVEGYKKCDVAITGITTEDISVNEVLKGQADVKMLKIAVEAKGELTPATITAFNITGADGEPVEASHIYTTGTTTTFSANTEFAENYDITNSGTYYFWLTYDVKTTAEVGQTATATLNSVVVNGAAIDVTEPATATITVASGKSGTYTVGQGGDYATIQGAIDDMNTLGMEGPVVLKIKAGEYNEKVRVPYIKGMGSVNTLTIESESGQRDVKIYHNNYTTGGYSDDQHKKDYGVITLYQASYVTLKNLEVYTTDKAYKAIVMVKDESRHVTIDNCYLHAPVCTASSGEDVCLVGHTIIDEENKNNDYLTVRNCLLEGGKMGVSMGGTSYVALPKEIGGVIEGNTFLNNGNKAIYLTDELGAKVRNNTITIESSVTTKISVGILDMQLRDEYDVATEITGNVFNVAPTSYAAVMNIRQVDAKETAPMIIANNVINLTSLNASYSAFKFNGAKVKNVNVANNTIRMTGENGGAAFWAASTFSEGYGVGINVVNNIIQNETSGFCVNIYNDGNIGKINFQNNLMYAAGETFYRAGSSTNGNFAAFVEKMGEAALGNINKQVTFVSDDILEPATTLDGDLLKAKKLDYVTTDVNGTVRPEENISIGAYEYNPNRTRVPVIAEGYPTATATSFNEVVVSVKADMAGKAYVVVLKAADEAPTAETMKASTYTAVLTKDAEATVKVDTLSEKTAYKAYVLVESAYGVVTELQTISDITTPMEPIELMIACTEPVTTVASGTETSLKVMVASGLAPYTVTWTDSKNQIVGEPIVTSAEGEEIVLNITPEQSGDYYVTIKDAQQYEAQDTCRIIVTGDAIAADFENLFLPSESHWKGPDTKGSIEEGIYGDSQYQGSFLSGSYKFSNNYSIDWASWSGFSYSNHTSTAGANIMADQFNACTGKGHNDSDNYAVFFEDEFAPMTISVLNKADGDSIRGFYITNAAVTVNAFLNGDGITPGAFEKGDYLKLTITADNNNFIDYYLADYTSENDEDHYYVNDWQWVDLSELGKVKELTFHMESSRKNSWGYTTPLYFCIDDFNGAAPAKPEGPATMEDLDLADESYWNGSDGTGSFVSGGFRFENGYELSEYGAYAYGFYYTNLTSKTSTGSNEMYNSVVGHGAEDSKTYATYNVNEWTPKGVEVISSEDGEVVSGFYVTNSAYAYASMTHGDSYAKRFGTNDWFKLTITGYDAAGEQTGTVDFYLADLRDVANAYILDTWRWVDLTSLGKVKRLGFTMSSSDTGMWGMNTPAYFCMDNLGGVAPENEEPITTGIKTMPQTAGKLQRFDLGGRQMQRQSKGMNIIRMEDGSVRKVVVK